MFMGVKSLLYSRNGFISGAWQCYSQLWPTAGDPVPKQNAGPRGQHARELPGCRFGRRGGPGELRHVNRRVGLNLGQLRS